MAETKIVRPAEGVSLYTGLGHSPFGSEHTVELPADHADALIKGKAASEHSPKAEAHAEAQDAPQLAHDAEE